MNVELQAKQTLKRLPPPTQEKTTNPPPETTEPPEGKEPGESVVLRGLAGTGKAIVGLAGATVGAGLGGLKGVVDGASSESTSKSAESGKTKKLLRKIGATAGLVAGVAVGLAFAPAGIAVAAAATTVTTLSGAAIGGTAPEVLPRMGKAVWEGAKGVKDGAVSGWKLARAPFESKDSPPAPAPKPETGASQ